MLKDLIDFCCIVFGGMFVILSFFVWLCVRFNEIYDNIPLLIVVAVIGSLMFMLVVAKIFLAAL